VADKITDIYQGKTILITGACGFIGSSLTKSLLNVNCKLILLDNSKIYSWISGPKQAEITIIQADVSHRQTWESALSGIDYLFHLAALEYNRANYNIMQDLQINAISVMHLLEVCRENHFKPHMVFTSSANLFGHVDSLPVNEKQQSHPMTPWAIHKLLAENYFKVYNIKYGINSTILRLTNVYGPTENRMSINNVIINNIISRALNGEPLRLYKNQYCIRDFIYLGDVVTALLYAGAKNSFLSDCNFFVIGSGEGNTFAEVWSLIARHVKNRIGKDIHVVHDNSIALEPFDMRNFIADTTLFSHVTGWQPSIFLEEGITLTINNLLSSKKEYNDGK
jgi:nucleoside-diphosphate-sugar epimerase